MKKTKDMKKLIVIGLILFVLILSSTSLQGYYGIIPTTVSNSYEWNGNTGNYLDMLRLGTSEYYLIAYSGPSSDGWVNTTRVWNDNGTIKQQTIDSLDFDTGTTTYMNLVHVNGDIYAVSYGTGSTIRTFKAWSSNGSIYPNTAGTYIDTIGLAYAYYSNDIIKVSGNMFVMAYVNTTYQGWLKSMYIDNTGNILPVPTALFNDTVCFNATYGRYPRLESIDSNTIALVYSGASSTYHGYVCTYNVSATTGDITNTPSDTWEFDGLMGYTPTIKHISGDVYAIAYENSTADITVGTVTITSTGDITPSWIDRLTIADIAASYPTLFTIDNLSVYGVTYMGPDNDGFVKTFNMSSTGVIGNAIIDSLEFAPNDGQLWSPISWVNKSYYYIVYTDVNEDGWSTVVNITTNYATPVLSSPSPTDDATGVSLSPVCAITIADLNTDTMTLTWFTNESGTPVNYGHNTSVFNGTYRQIASWADATSTKYWWTVYANDGVHNTSTTYTFTTTSGGWDNRKPTFSNPVPTNNSVSITRYPLTSVIISDLDGNDSLVCFWYSLSDSPYSWTKAQQNNSITANTTARDTNASYALNYNTEYWWKVTAYDGHENASAIYHFTTETSPLIETTKVIDHLLGYTPNFIAITPTSYPGSYVFYCVDTITSTQFTIHMYSETGVTVSFMWKAEKI